MIVLPFCVRLCLAVIAAISWLTKGDTAVARRSYKENVLACHSCDFGFGREESTLMDDLESVAIGIENIRNIITRIILQSCARRDVFLRFCREGCSVENINLGVVFRDKSP